MTRSNYRGTLHQALWWLIGDSLEEEEDMATKEGKSSGWEKYYDAGKRFTYKSHVKPDGFKFEIMGYDAGAYVIKWLGGPNKDVTENVTRFWMECHAR